jgi:hypothetical protein
MTVPAGRSTQVFVDHVDLVPAQVIQRAVFEVIDADDRSP